jgi:hypothetical protein
MFRLDRPIIAGPCLQAVEDLLEPSAALLGGAPEKASEAGEECGTGKHTKDDRPHEDAGGDCRGDGAWPEGLRSDGLEGVERLPNGGHGEQYSGGDEDPACDRPPVSGHGDDDPPFRHTREDIAGALMFSLLTVSVDAELEVVDLG